VPLTQALVDFKASVMQCDNLIASAHRTDTAGASLFPVIDQQQISVAAFLNMFIAWETFLESSLLHLMIGRPTVSGNLPVRRVVPLTIDDARGLVKGISRHFDYANHMNVRLVVRMYFDNGYPYEPHLSSIYQELDDLRTIRNSCAHITASTRLPLEGLATRIARRPVAGLTVYKLLTMPDPTSAGAGTVLETYKRKLIVAAELIAQG
jgi:hypothetical protein